MKQKEFTVAYFAGEGSTNQIIYRTRIKGFKSKKNALLDEAKAQYREPDWVSKTATIMAYITQGDDHVAMCEITNRPKTPNPRKEN